MKLDVVEAQERAQSRERHAERREEQLNNPIQSTEVAEVDLQTPQRRERARQARLEREEDAWMEQAIETAAEIEAVRGTAETAERAKKVVEISSGAEDPGEILVYASSEEDDLSGDASGTQDCIVVRQLVEESQFRIETLENERSENELFLSPPPPPPPPIHNIHSIHSIHSTSSIPGKIQTSAQAV